MNKKAIRGILIAVAAAALCVCVWCGWYLVQYYKGQAFGSTMREIRDSETAVPPASGAALGPVEIPVDFDALREINPDIYAWVEIPGTDISYAVLQHPEDDTFYMNHSENGDYYSGGSIFSERCSAKDFSDKMTVLYGHNLRSGRMFAQLNNFADSEVFETHRRICVYLPDRVLLYEIFAAYPHSSEHLLLNYDFSDRVTYRRFFTEIQKTQSLQAQLLPDAMPDYDKHSVLTLSTCFRGNNRQRYLVQGRLIAEIPGK